MRRETEEGGVEENLPPGSLVMGVGDEAVVRTLVNGMMEDFALRVKGMEPPPRRLDLLLALSHLTVLTLMGAAEQDEMNLPARRLLANAMLDTLEFHLARHFGEDRLRKEK